MKVPPRESDAFARKPAPAALAVLVYGPDEGLARERLDLLTRSVVADIKDPFNVVELTGATLADDPARLRDEAQSISMLGGRRVIRLRGADDKCAGTVKETLAALKPGDNFIVIEGGDLSTRSPLRQLFETADNAAAIGCYVDDQRDTGRVIGDALREAGMTAEPEALAYLSANMLGDRAIIRSEIEKLILYMGKEKRVTLDDAVACAGNAAALPLDDLARHAASGNFAAADRILDHLLSEGLPAVTILRALQNHFLRLHVTKARLQKGENTAEAMAKLKPPVFFKIKDAFTAQLNGWSALQMEQALGLLSTAEAKSKQTGSEPATLCGRALLAISQIGNRAVRRG